MLENLYSFYLCRLKWLLLWDWFHRWFHGIHPPDLITTLCSAGATLVWSNHPLIKRVLNYLVVIKVITNYIATEKKTRQYVWNGSSRYSHHQSPFLQIMFPQRDISPKSSTIYLIWCFCIYIYNYIYILCMYVYIYILYI